MIIKGTAVSEGMALGSVYIYEPFRAVIGNKKAAAGSEKEQLGRWLEARDRANEELGRMVDVDGDAAEIMRAHSEMLFDEEIAEMVADAIEGDGATADSAVESAFDSFAQLLEKVSDPLIAARSADLRDVKQRLLRILAGEEERSLSRLEKPMIVAAHELLPSDTAAMDREKVLGIITETGGQTSHTAIIARSLKIPAVLGVKDAARLLRDGMTVALDALSGEVCIEPDDGQTACFKMKNAEFCERVKLEREFLNKDAALKSGEGIKIGINVGGSDFDGYESCDFVGLLRTEFLYMDADALPDEESQTRAYREILERAAGKPVTLRTLDIGGDKTLSYMQLPREDNPFLGKRALRLCFEREDIFRTQLAAALRASAYGEMQIMFPMIGGIEDFRRAKKYVEEVKNELSERGLEYDRDIKLGVMIEVPSAALTADLLARECDFASIGTNDLCQYICAADRMNSSVDDCYRPFSPGVLRAVALAIESFNALGREISVCGEMAGDPRAAILLAGMGLRKFSMAASNIARVKRALSLFTLEQAKKTAAAALAAATQEEVLALAQ